MKLFEFFLPTAPPSTPENDTRLIQVSVAQLLVFVLLFGTQPGFSTPSSPDSLQWQADFPSAQALAQETGKSILLVFSGSDWCRPCMQLEQEVLQSESFATFAGQHLILLRADFPRARKRQLPPRQQAHNAELAERYNPKGAFPLIVLLDPMGRPLDQIGYQSGGPQAYLTRWQSKWEDE
jgi:thioredoxin-related protein